MKAWLAWRQREFIAHGLRPKLKVITGAEFNEKEILMGLANSANVLVLVTPGGGTLNAGTLTQFLYTVEVLTITKRPERDAATVWRARVDTRSGAYGFHVDGRLEKFAEQLVDTLISERVLAVR